MKTPQIQSRYRLLLLLSAALLALRLPAQQTEIAPAPSNADAPASTEDSNNENRLNPTTQSASTAQPFSAEKYERTVRITPDGKQVILSESRPIKLARSALGQIRVKGVNIDADCDRPTPPPHPECSSEEVTLFDPIGQTVTHWGEGSVDAHSSVVLPISSSRAARIEADTSNMPDKSGSFESEGATVTTKDLGQKTIEGLSATGLRTTITLPARARGNKDTITTIHEVWTSTDMNLVVQVIDAQTTGSSPITKETIHGLDHVSTSPDPALFLPPGDYEHQDYRVTNPGKPSDQHTKHDMVQYAAWFVK